MSIPKIVLFSFLSAFLTSTFSFAADSKNIKSTYLDISKCVLIEGPTDEEGYQKSECNFIAGIRLFSEMGDARSWLSFQRPNDKEATPIANLGVLSSGFPFVMNSKIEVRYTIEKNILTPIGVIYRVGGTDVLSDEVPPPKTQTLVSVSFIGNKVSLVGETPSTQKNANEVARKKLDALLK